MSEAPLYVQVARALGCDPVWNRDLDWCCHCKQDRHGNRPHFKVGDATCLRRYDTSWEATGPIIEKLRIQLESDSNTDGTVEWSAMTEMEHLPTSNPADAPYGGRWQNAHVAEGATPLVAVCLLILELKAAKRLPKGLV